MESLVDIVTVMVYDTLPVVPLSALYRSAAGIQ
jgi:hypothetical protein